MTRCAGMWLGGLAVFLLLPVKVSLAAEEPNKPAQTQGTQMARFRGGERQPDRLVRELGLSGEQETRLRQLLEEFRQTTRTWWGENGYRVDELRAEWREAREAKDEARVKELREQLKTLLASRLAPRENLFKQLKAMLTPEQVEQVKDAVVEWRARMWRAAREMNFSEAQRAKLRQVLENWREEMEDETVPDLVAKARQALVEKVITDVILTGAQRQALAKMPAGGELMDKVSQLDLSEEQKGQIEALNQRPLERGRRGESAPQREPPATTRPSTVGEKK